MSMVRVVLVCLVMAVASVVMQGCGGVCKNTAAMYVTGIGLVAEAESALGQVEAMLSVSSLPKEQKEQIAELLRKGHESLQKSSALMRQLKESCDASKDLPGIFSDFNAVWTTLRPFIPAIVSAVGAGSGQPIIEDPTCYRLR